MSRDDFRFTDLCTQVVRASGLSSVTIVVSGRHNREGATVHSNTMATAVHDLEYTLGEGPINDALVHALPTIATDLQTSGGRWPLFAPTAVRELDVAAISAVPLNVGAVRLGALALYSRKTPGWQDGEINAVDVLEIAYRTVSTLLDMAEIAAPDGTKGLAEEMTAYRAVVHQATGMVAAQLRCDMTDALLRLRAMAYANATSVEHVALAIVDRRIRATE